MARTIEELEKINAELLEMARLLERSLDYEIKKFEHVGDAEGANLKTFMLHQVRAVIARAEGTTA